MVHTETITGVGGSLSRANPAAVGEITMPLPPLEKQKEIVAEIERAIRKSSTVLRPLLKLSPPRPIHPDWPMVAIDNIVEFVSGLTVSIPEVEAEGGTPILAIDNKPDGKLTLEGLRWIKPPTKTLNYVQKGDLLFN